MVRPIITSCHADYHNSDNTNYITTLETHFSQESTWWKETLSVPSNEKFPLHIGIGNWRFSSRSTSMDSNSAPNVMINTFFWSSLPILNLQNIIHSRVTESMETTDCLSFYVMYNSSVSIDSSHIFPLYYTPYHIHFNTRVNIYFPL